MKEQFDFIVVGAGNAGAVVASRIANSRRKPSVLLIEAGGKNDRDELYVPSDRYTNVYLHPDIRFDYHTTPQKHLDGRVLEYLRGKGLGGSSLANFLGYIRGSAADYNTWASMVGDDDYGWNQVVERYKEVENLHFEDDDDPDQPVKLAEGAHGFDGPLDLEVFPRSKWPRGTDILRTAAHDFGWPLNPDQNSGQLVGVGSVTTTTYKGRRTTSSSAFLADVPSNLSIWTNTSVQKIIFEPSAPTSGSVPKAVGVRLQDGREVHATHETILSLGSIDTPKLLMLSGIGERAMLNSKGIPCVVDLPNVGKELIDHSYLVLRWGTTSELSDRTAFNLNETAVAAARKEWLETHSGPDATRNIGNLVGFLKLDPDRYSSAELNKLAPVVQQWLRQDNVPQFEVFLAGMVPAQWDTNNGPEALSVAVMLMNPQSRGSVSISSSDPAAMPVIDVNFMEHPYDRKTYVDAVREVVSFIKSEHLSKYILKDVNVPKLDSDEEILQFIKDNLMSVLHGVGTTKMGAATDSSACVDTHMRVRGVEKLRVVDLSVCPIITNNHTQSTAYLVGQIGWKKIVKEYQLDQEPPQACKL